MDSEELRRGSEMKMKCSCVDCDNAASFKFIWQSDKQEAYTCSDHKFGVENLAKTMGFEIKFTKVGLLNPFHLHLLEVKESIEKYDISPYLWLYNTNEALVKDILSLDNNISELIVTRVGRQILLRRLEKVLSITEQLPT